jgi:lysozyme
VTAGIDVSEWQGRIDWPAVAAAGVSFAAIRAGDGLRHPDPRFAENWAAAGAAGVARAAYLFCRTDQKPLEQAAFLAASGADGELAPWVDFETAAPSSARPLVWLAAFVGELERRAGRTPTIYTGPAFWRSLGPASRNLVWARYPLAIAHYTKRAAPDVPAPWTTYTWWQHTSAGRVPGIGGLVDLDISIVGAITAAPAPREEHPLMHLNAPVVEIVVNPAGPGYWQVAADGGIFTFGGVRSFPENDLPARKLNAPIVSADCTPSGQGLILNAADGGIFTFGDAQYAGSIPELPG